MILIHIKRGFNFQLLCHFIQAPDMGTLLWLHGPRWQHQQRKEKMSSRLNALGLCEGNGFAFGLSEPAGRNGHSPPQKEPMAFSSTSQISPKINSQRHTRSALRKCVSPNRVSTRNKLPGKKAMCH